MFKLAIYGIYLCVFVCCGGGWCNLLFVTDSFVNYGFASEEIILEFEIHYLNADHTLCKIILELNTNYDLHCYY